MARLCQTFARHPPLAPTLTRPGTRRAILRAAAERGHQMTSADARQFFEDNLRCSGGCPNCSPRSNATAYFRH
jgi:hypothetical protein